MEGCPSRELHECLHSGSTRESVYLVTGVSSLNTRHKIIESLPVQSTRRRELVMMPEARLFVFRHRKGLYDNLGWSVASDCGFQSIRPLRSCVPISFVTFSPFLLLCLLNNHFLL